MWADSDSLDELDPLDDILVAELRQVLVAPVPDEPSADELDGLRAAVAARFPHSETRTFIPRSHRRPRRARVVWRAGSVAAAVVLLSGSAAAATGGVPLPRPLRAFAYAVGLPVDSPALDDTHRHLAALEHAIDQEDHQEVRRTVGELHDAFARVPDDEHDEVEEQVAVALAAAAPVLDALAGVDAGSLPDDGAPGEPARPAPATEPPVTASPGSGEGSPPSADGEVPAPRTGGPATAPTVSDPEGSGSGDQGADSGGQHSDPDEQPEEADEPGSDTSGAGSEGPEPGDGTLSDPDGPDPDSPGTEPEEPAIS